MLKYFFKRFEKKEVGERAANHPLPLSLSFFLSSRPLIENEFRYAEDRVSFFLSLSLPLFFPYLHSGRVDEQPSWRLVTIR